MEYTDAEKDMARKGYVYRRHSNGSNGQRKLVRNLSGEHRADLIFDTPTYEQHYAPK